MINDIILYLSTYQSALLKALGETFDMLLFAMVISLIFGLLTGLLLFLTRPSGVYQNKLIYTTLSTIVNITRSVPFILFIIVLIPISRFIIGTGFGVNASKLPLSLIGIATFARLAEQSLLEVSKDSYETSYALGANTYEYIRDFLLREARSGLVLSFTSTTISLLSYSTVVGVIGGGGLGYLAISEGYQNFNYPLMWIIIAVMIVIVQLVQLGGTRLAKHIDKR